jgi:hypothetical protein
MCGGWAFFFLAIVAVYFLQYFKLISKSKIIFEISQKINIILVWNLFLVHFLCRYISLIFCATAGLRFYSLNSFYGKFDFFLQS